MFNQIFSKFSTQFEGGTQSSSQKATISQLAAAIPAFLAELNPWFVSKLINLTG
jgi:hypothetical protein